MNASEEENERSGSESEDTSGKVPATNGKRYKNDDSFEGEGIPEATM